MFRESALLLEPLKCHSGSPRGESFPRSLRGAVSPLLSIDHNNPP